LDHGGPLSRLVLSQILQFLFVAVVSSYTKGREGYGLRHSIQQEIKLDLEPGILNEYAANVASPFLLPASPAPGIKMFHCR
jgi:hypothetical protein